MSGYFQSLKGVAVDVVWSLGGFEVGPRTMLLFMTLFLGLVYCSFESSLPASRKRRWYLFISIRFLRQHIPMQADPHFLVVATIVQKLRFRHRPDHDISGQAAGKLSRSFASGTAFILVVILILLLAKRERQRRKRVPLSYHLHRSVLHLPTYQLHRSVLHLPTYQRQRHVPEPSCTEHEHVLPLPTKFTRQALY